MIWRQRRHDFSRMLHDLHCDPLCAAAQIMAKLNHEHAVLKSCNPQDRNALFSGKAAKSHRKGQY
ncbi:MAG: hypothetical protein IJB19_05940 [Clostridia bacterium]|nr:hypothetical protein [Clostridia bacterium]